MILAFLNYITDSVKTSMTSLGGAIVGQFASTSPGNLEWANVALQHAAWLVAIVAGILTIINLFFPLRMFYNRYKTTHNQEKIDENVKED